MSRAVIGILFLILSSCHDEKGIEINCRRQAILDGQDDCKNLGRHASWTPVGKLLTEAVFNPKNEDEIAFVE